MTKSDNFEPINHADNVAIDQNNHFKVTISRVKESVTVKSNVTCVQNWSVRRVGGEVQPTNHFKNWKFEWRTLAKIFVHQIPAIFYCSRFIYQWVSEILEDQFELWKFTEVRWEKNYDWIGDKFYHAPWLGWFTFLTRGQISSITVDYKSYHVIWM